MTSPHILRALAVALTVPVAVMLGSATAALAAPGQPGVDSTATDQAGVTNSVPSTDDWEYLGGINPDAQFEDAPTQPVPTNSAPLRTYTAPQRARTSPAGAVEPVNPAPAPQVRVAPVQAAPDTLRFGANVIQRPPWLPRDLADQSNNTFAVIEASGDTALRTAGIDAPRADRVAAGSVAGAVGGGLLAAAVVGVPAVALSSGGGALIGAAVGAAVTAPVAAVAAPVVGTVPGAVAGAAAGALVGAAAGAAAAVPAVVGAAGVGTVVGGVVGGAFAAGSEPDSAQPMAPTASPSGAPTFDQVTASAQQSLRPLTDQVDQVIRSLPINLPR
ncbi:hypothetical protein GCM10007304_14270 [Rhodococcoides trifolii]|uniref:Insoluble domain protein n=1 Tax=Rhodococcoides trifolii TaxID=908250 RepID=A0A917CZV6_9NOCA|nr:hypothetical protein [Rhodococcus trifolii]GGG01433.1 hypothetical protein GCM10007304_14270 [Rhodococcus trifolii]